MNFTGIVLAAGAGTRFDRDKRQLVLPNGDNLLMHSVRQMRAVLEDVVVVLRTEDTDLVAVVRSLRCRACCNHEPGRGMGSSLGCGVQASRDAPGWLIRPVDLPLLRTDTLRRIAARLQTADAVVPLCHGRRGHPVGFSHRFRDQLCRLSGPHGGQKILQQAADSVVWLNTHDPGIHRDVDRPADLATLVRQMPL